MKKIPVLFLLLVLSGLFAAAQGGTFSTGNKEFLLNGRPYVIRAAELHYPRIPKEYWEHRIQLCKAMGMNTICIYLFWNLHEQEMDKFDFTGQKDVAEFVRLVQKNGMYCIVRPGPYVCAEWEMGGLPWWLLKKKDIKLRDLSDTFFMERTGLFFKQAARQLAPLQIQNGGNIIMVQVENEYATYGSDQAYMEAIRDKVRSAGFDKVQLFRCDWSSNFNKYKLDGVATTLNFGAGSNVDNQFKTLQAVYPTAPLMCSEYWTGWFDHWGRPHETRSISSFIGSLKDMMDRKVSFSLYMAHGGTSFGQWGGANAPPYSAMVSSYDYNAPINEQGGTTDKFFAVQELLKNYLQEGESIGTIPPAMPVIQIPAFNLEESAPLFNNLPRAKTAAGIQPMEEFDQGWGRILYRTQLPKARGVQKLTITEVHDWANVFVNGKPVGKLDRRRGDNSLTIPPLPSGGQLDILVEATGRVNYGKAILDHKGITESVTIADAGGTRELTGWKVYNFPVDYHIGNNLRYSSTKLKGPAWYRGSFQLSETGDTFLDVSTWGKGMVWVNGHNLGRFWKIGPQQTLFLPGIWLRKGKNTIVVLDVDRPSATTIAGNRKPVLDKINPDESLLHRKKGETLDLSKETPFHTGTVPAGPGWKEIVFSTPARGRYLCLEALNAQLEKDPLTSIAEIELLGADGKVLAALKWKVAYASSEEITAGNYNAEKIYDQQESTFWQTQTTGAKPAHPHLLVIDLGQDETIKAMRYLPRSDKKTNGMIKDYRIYVKQRPFTF